MSNFNFVSFNIRGINDINKANFLKDFMNIHRIGICYLQETHIDSPSYAEELGNVFCDYLCFFTVGSGKTRGVSILINKSLSFDFNVSNTQYDLDSRFLRIELKLINLTFNLINIYAPNTENEQFEFINNV